MSVTELYHELLPFAIEHNVKIATENMWNWDHTNDMATFAACATPESFCKHIDVVNSDYLVACVDIGHAEMKGLNTTASEMIYTLGSKVQALHIHDNDKWHDSHQIPFTMNIDFEPIVKALKEINYDGYFTLECDSYLKAYNAENIEEGVKNLSDSVKKLADMCYMSSSRFYEVFREAVGESPINYKNRIRVSYAKMLIQEGSHAGGYH